VGPILIVEDDDDLRDDIADILREAGAEVATARDGREALEVLRRDPVPTLILLDLMMPRMSGWEFRAAQRQEANLAHIPVVVMSGVAGIGELAERVAPAAILRKPFSIDALLRVVASLYPLQRS
jgi:CheY-like chemotaxis protein